MQDSDTSKEYELIVGLEIHVELSTATKIFCGCVTAVGSPPNTQVCPVCLGLPGSLPQLNEHALQNALKIAVALDCQVPSALHFERKHYFYPDLPKNFQISQHSLNLGSGGRLRVKGSTRASEVRISNVHLEEDAGKTLHSSWSDRSSSIDLNRAGTSLVEIVTEPDIRSSDEAVRFMRTLRRLLQYLEVSDCNMHEGRLRFEANVSVRRRGSVELGTKVEVKNVNSIKFVQRAIDYEMARHITILEGGDRVLQETRSWDSTAGITRPMRSKEEAHDYRYFPEPDLPRNVLPNELVQRIRADLPELPDAKQARFVADFGLSEHDAGILTERKVVASLFEAAARIFPKPQAICNWIQTEYFARDAHGDGRDLASNVSATPVALARLLQLVDQQVLTGASAKAVFHQMIKDGTDPDTLVAQLGVAQMTDEKALCELIRGVLRQNADALQEYRNGRTKVLSFLVGQVMRATAGRADPTLVQRLMHETIE